MATLIGVLLAIAATVTFAIAVERVWPRSWLGLGVGWVLAWIDRRR